MSVKTIDGRQANDSGSNPLTTTNTTATVIATVAIPDSSCVCLITLYLACYSTSLNEGACYVRYDAYKNVAGTLTQIPAGTGDPAAGAPCTKYDTDESPIAITFVISGTNVLIKVAGVGVQTIVHKCRVDTVMLTAA